MCICTQSKTEEKSRLTSGIVSSVNPPQFPWRLSEIVDSNRMLKNSHNPG